MYDKDILLMGGISVSALMLKIIACLCMLLDHIGYFWRIEWLRIIGRLAFPIFVYLIYNGYRHTSSKLRYALRLALFAIVSQIPFSLFCYGTLWHQNGNVFFTLLAALISLWCTDVMRRNKVLRWFCLLPAILLCWLYHRGILASDYGAKGILLILVFYFTDRKGLGWKLLTVLGFFCAIYYAHLISWAKTAVLQLLGTPRPFPILDDWQITQAWSALSLPLIFAYNGKKGPSPKNRLPAKLCQLGFYLFYPLHMVILWLLSTL